jgi:uncharacterized membrane protein
METNRLEAFSDGVFAIVITLLVLELKIPLMDNLGAGLIHLWPSYLAYVMSFIVIGAIWINHHAMFAMIAKTDHKLLLLNTLHLLPIAFLPFATAVLADSLHERASQHIATMLYGGTLTLIGLLVTAMWYYAARNRHLLVSSITEEQARRVGRHYLIGPGGYALATTLALISHWVAIALFVLLNAYFLWPRRTSNGGAA